MPTFDLVVVGCGGGPSETNLSAYLLKPCDKEWYEGIIALEAGSGLGALTKLCEAKPKLFSPKNRSSSALSAFQLHSYIRSYLITHAHLDHVNGLVLTAGTQCKPPRKRVFALPSVLDNLATIFSDRAWPNLASSDENDGPHKLLYQTLVPERVQEIGCGLSVRAMPVSHGRNAAGKPYESTAFFVKHDASARELLFFGDVEPDAVAGRSLNAAVWRAAAPKVHDGRLNTIFIECSYPAGRKDELLYGHLTPQHLVTELETLAGEVAKLQEDGVTAPPRKRRRMGVGMALRSAFRGGAAVSEAPAALRDALKDVRICIIHCKEDLEGKYSRPIPDIITEQVRALVKERGLGAEIFAAKQGMHITI